MAKKIEEVREIKVKLNHTLDVDHMNFEAIRREMADIEKAYPQYKRFDVQMEPEAYSDREYPQVYGVRDETAEEVVERTTKAAADKKAREDRDRAEFERLSKIFGDKQ